MKIRTAIVSVVVSAALVAGGGYGAYYAFQGKGAVIEVVPVSNVNVGGYYWGMTDSVSGTVTSQVSQRVMLNDEYSVAQICVEEGQEVKEGEVLFIYDMTLQELELELEQLSLQTQELTQMRLEKELEKLKRTPASASLSRLESVRTASADTILEEPQTEPVPAEAVEPQSEAVGITIEGIETETDPGLTQLGNEEEILEGIVENYMLGINELFLNLQQSDLSDAQMELISELLEQLVSVSHNTLMDRKEEQQTAEDGTEKKVVSYQVKQDIVSLLEADQVTLLEKYTQQLEKCQVQFIKLLIQRAERSYQVDAAAFIDYVEQVRKSYDRLSTAAQEEANVLEQILELEALAEQESERESETMQETEPATEEISGTEVETETGTETETETESETEPATETEQTTETEPETEPATETEPTTETEPESETNTESESETENESETETETESDLTLLSGYINSYLELSAGVLAESADQQENYRIRLEDALIFYQTWLAQPQDDILDETDTAPKMSDYVLKTQVQTYLKEEQKEHLLTEMENSYKEICMRYVQTCITELNPQVLVREEWEAAKKAYLSIGEAWQIELEERWMQQQNEEEQQPETEEMESEGDTVQEPLTLAQLLQAYEMILIIEELNAEAPEELLIPALEKAYESYQALNEQQKMLVWNQDVLLELLEKYGLWEQETESEWDDFGDFGDFGDDFGGFEYTAEELKQLISDKESEIKECSLTIREMELSVAKRKRVVDGKIVKSTLDGTVVSVGGIDGSGDEYFVEVTNATGLYAKGVISELALETINVGDTITGMSYENNMSFTAVIKEVSEYPDPDGANMSYGNGNSNAAYYPFYALIDDPEGVQEGYVELQLSSSEDSMEDAIYLENFFVRTGSDGKSYVFLQGEDGKLKKQTVVTGKRMYSYAIQIVSGLTLEDKIAFPYGKDVKEGADTKEVDALQSAYM